MNLFDIDAMVENSTTYGWKPSPRHWVEMKSKVDAIHHITLTKDEYDELLKNLNGYAISYDDHIKHANRIIKWN
jgi:hypothetical protein